MGFVVLGILLIVLKLLDFGGPAIWSWWIVLSPFALAVVWWTWADKSGYTQRREMEKMDARRDARREKNLVALGIDPRKHSKQSEKSEAYKAKRAREAEKVESKRDAKRRKDRDSILNSRIDSSHSTHGPQSSQIPSGRGDSTGSTKR
jgi:small Trp-rich protein